MAASILSGGAVPLDTTIYPRACVAKAAEAYREFLNVEVVASEQNTLIVSLSVLPRSVAEASKARVEFLNYLLDLAVQHHLAVE